MFAAGAVGLGVLLLGSLLAWRLADRVVRPVTALTSTARSISETDLSGRIPVHGNDEVAQLARTFNDMLDRLERAFASQRRFADDASHELKTPLTIVRGHLELLEDDPVEREETLALVTDELDRMGRIVEDLLLLARREEPDFLALDDGGRRRADRRAAGEGLGARHARLGARRARAGRDRRRPPAADAGDGAARRERSPLQRTRPADRDRLDRVGRRGAVLGSRPRAGDRAARAGRRSSSASGGEPGTGRSDGAGLGLAIVKAIAEAHHGPSRARVEPGGLRLLDRRARRPAAGGAGGDS